MAPALIVENVAKRYRISRTAGSRPLYRTLREDLMSLAAAPLRWWRIRKETRKAEDFWALKDVSFEVRQGDVVGIIGRNGAGKSTLLKIISKVTRPTSGRVRLRGRVGSLLEVGTGFHQELTGRENVYLSGAVLGMTQREITRKFDEIVAFAEVDRFLDTPVKRYSTGMYTRLAFAVAAHLHPEILVVDEVLAVGDAAFQRKCLGKMGMVASEGRTVLFVSHNMAAVRQLCSRGVYLQDGRVATLGAIGDCVNQYLESEERGGRTIVSHLALCDPSVSVESLTVCGSELDRVRLPSNTASLPIEIAGRLVTALRFDLAVVVRDRHGVPLAVFSPGHELPEVAEQPAGPFVLRRVLPLPRITQGEYFLDLYLNEPELMTYAHLPRAVRISAEGSTTATGHVFEYGKGSGWVIL